MLRQIVFKTPIPKSHFLSCVFARGMASENFVLHTIYTLFSLWLCILTLWLYFDSKQEFTLDFFFPEKLKIENGHNNILFKTCTTVRENW